MKSDGRFHLVLLTTAIVASAWLMATVSGEVFAECEGVAERTFTASTKSCRIFIFCDGDESFEGFCEDDGYFDAVEGVCDDRDKVECRLDGETNGNGVATPPAPTVPAPTPTTPTTTTTTTTTTPTTTTAPTPSTTPSTTVGLTSESVAPSNEPITETTTTAASTPTALVSTLSTTTTAGTTTTNTSSSCPIVDDPFQIVFLPNPNSCSEYYVCINGVPVDMYCSEMLHFNVQTGKCDYPENVQCWTDYSRPKEQCQRHIVDFYPHTSNCNYFYRCQNGFLMLQQCPLSFGWDYEKRTCVALNKAKCFNRTRPS